MEHTKQIMKDVYYDNMVDLKQHVHDSIKSKVLDKIEQRKEEILDTINNNYSDDKNSNEE
jgi:Mg/Co/Ni transporter MgtE